MKDEIKEIVRILATSKKYITYAERCYVLDYIYNLQRYVDETFLYTYEELQDKVISLQFKVIEKQEKINKAIEYLTDETKELIEDSYYKVYNLSITDDLLNILQGSEE